MTWHGTGLATSAFLSHWAGWVVYTDRRLDSLRGERGEEEKGAMNSGPETLGATAALSPGVRELFA